MGCGWGCGTPAVWKKESEQKSFIHRAAHEEFEAVNLETLQVGAWPVPRVLKCPHLTSPDSPEPA